MRMRIYIVAIVALAVPSGAIAQTGCVTRGEAEIVVTALAPSLIQSIRQRCSGFLPAGAALTGRGDAMASRYAPAASDARPQAVAIAEKIAFDGEDNPFPGLFDNDAVLDAFETGMTVAVAQQLDAESCPIANDIFDALEPLPVENFASLFVTFIQIGARSENTGPGDSPFRICAPGENP